ncbi:MAG: UDP-N-acetylmuramate dehydrogenase [Rhodobacteraceae bacterium]|nr:UDP-N-acetylmuramate dehydrogenase [Paracoccaceae bacterium]
MNGETGQMAADTRRLAEVTWLRVGGPADRFHHAADLSDLLAVLRGLPGDMPVFPLGAGSNLIVRDGGIRGAVIRLGRGFMECGFADGVVTAGAGLPDAVLARRAAAAGHDLTFLRTIPGTIGGAVRMNAGCYGSYVADVLESVQVVHRDGTVENLSADSLALAYRHSDLPPDSIVTSARFNVPRGDPVDLVERMETQIARRDATQPVKELTAGSTFRNPAGFSSTGRADDVHDLKAWKLIEDAGMRGARRGGAMMSDMHANFLTNTGGASAADLEGLGEDVRKKVYETSGIRLEWEIMRVGEP